MATYEMTECGRAGAFLSAVRSFLRLIRIEYCLLGAGAVLAGAFVTSEALPDMTVVLSATAVFFVAAGCYAFDDYFDRDSDAVNGRWDRPLVSGSSTPQVAFAVGALAFLLSAIAALLADASTAIIVALGAVLAMVYNRWLQGLFPLKNILLAGAFPAPLVIGALAAGSPGPILLYCAGLAYVAGMGFEVMIDIPDVAGDRAKGIETVSTRFGSELASRVSAAIYILAAALAVVPFFLSIDPRFQWNLLFLVLAGAAAVAHGTIGRNLIRDHSSTRVLSLKSSSFVTLNLLILAYVIAILLQRL